MKKNIKVLQVIPRLGYGGAEPGCYDLAHFLHEKNYKDYQYYGFDTSPEPIEYARKNINVNCVSPGFIKTEMTDKINEEFKKNLINQIPSGTLGTGEDVSNCVAFLASDMANYINGETIHVNGGMYMA